MKKIAHLFVFVSMLSTVLTSCTKDISGPVDTNFAEGKWNFDKSTISSGIITIPYTNNYLKNEDGCAKDYIELLAGGAAKNGHYTSGCALELKTGTWSTSGTTLTMALVGTDVDGTFTIASLSETQLILKADATYQGKSGTLNMYFTK